MHEEFGSSYRSGKLVRLSQNTRVEQTHDGSGQLDERNSSSAHIVKEQFAPEENRDIALFNTDNAFNRAINGEDIDFNIPGLPHSAVKQEHGASVHNLIQKIENHLQGQALQIDFQQRQQFNLFIKESKQMIHEVGNVELCELPKAQCKECLSTLGRGQRPLHMRTLLAQRNGGEQKICPAHHGFLLDSELLCEERATPRVPLREEAGDHEHFIANSIKKKCKKRHVGYSRPLHP